MKPFSCNKHRSYREQSIEIVTQHCWSRQRENPVIQIRTHVSLMKTFFFPSERIIQIWKRQSWSLRLSHSNEILNEAWNCRIKKKLEIRASLSCVLMHLAQRKRAQDEKFLRRCYQQQSHELSLHHSTTLLHSDMCGKSKWKEVNKNQFHLSTRHVFA